MRWHSRFAFAFAGIRDLPLLSLAFAICLCFRWHPRFAFAFAGIRDLPLLSLASAIR
ncbi:rod shape-determining protein (plasmid) [Paraburkholderia caribensis MBA4]|uniref:Rod shape-determining protein n=1 Tax=Paraburkholderia caribensis MBA4 TaxID=1323664 RepID=A0A0P0RRG3_9BURK|nr:rod shape-determining protein [Paraburkholderia caribensis MBA4]